MVLVALLGQFDPQNILGVEGGQGRRRGQVETLIIRSGRRIVADTRPVQIDKATRRAHVLDVVAERSDVADVLGGGRRGLQPAGDGQAR